MDWAVEAAAELPPVNTTLAVIHIPVPQFLEMWQTRPTRGSKGEEVACPLVDTGVFDALRWGVRRAQAPCLAASCETGLDWARLG